MRIKNKKFGSRTPFFEKLQEPKSKYILVCEGEKTETQYFDGVEKYKQELLINPLIELRPVLRSYSQRSHSHPIKILDQLIEYLEQNLEKGIKASVLIDRIIGYMFGEGRIDRESVYNADALNKDLEDFLYICRGLEKDSRIKDIKNTIKLLGEHLNKRIDLKSNAEKIVDYIWEQTNVFDKEIDKVCLIVDRDPQSFKEEQYDCVLTICKKQGFDFYISNPCFEFWLLLHSKEVLVLPQEKMLENNKSGANKRYLESELRRIYSGYKKNKINFLNFKDSLKVAIQNEKEFCEDVIQLKTKLGSNIGVLMNELLSK